MGTSSPDVRAALPGHETSYRPDRDINCEYHFIRRGNQSTQRRESRQGVGAGGSGGFYSSFPGLRILISGQDFVPIMGARLKYRPIVSLLMYTVIPVDRRVVFGSACGVIWGVYLSLYAVV